MSAGQPTDPRGRFVRTMEGVERDTEACRLRSRGLSYSKISDQLGYGGTGNARRAVTNMLASIPVEAVNELRQLMRDKLDDLYTRAMDLVETEYVKINSGVVVMNPEGEPMIDHEPVRRALETASRIAAQQCALDGLNAPVRVATEAESTVRHEIVGVNVEAL